MDLDKLTAAQLNNLSAEDLMNICANTLSVNDREKLGLPAIKPHKPEPCCDNPSKIKNSDKVIVCRNCGTYLRCPLVNDCYIDYYENQWKIRKKSVYNRKYYIKNKLKILNLTYEETTLFMKVWGFVMSYMNHWMKEHNCNRMVKIDYLIMKSLQLIELIHKPIVCKINEPTLTEYEKLWEKIHFFVSTEIGGHKSVT